MTLEGTGNARPRASVCRRSRAGTKRVPRGASAHASAPEAVPKSEHWSLQYHNQGFVLGQPTVIDHEESLRTSSKLVRWFREMYEPRAMNIEPKDVIRILNRIKVKFILMGAHGISGWLPEPRATQDVDVLVLKSHHAKAVSAVAKSYPNLVVLHLPAVTRFLDPVTQKPVVDLMKPEEELYADAFRYTVSVGKTHRVPNLELALACKYGAMYSIHREREKRMKDAVDFVGMAKHHFDRIDFDVLFSLGEMVKNGGGHAIRRLVEDARHDRPMLI